MDKTSRNRFRSDNGINQWLACALNMVSGRFYPTNEKDKGLYFVFNTDNISQICDIIRRQSSPQLCLNDKAISASKLEECIREVSNVFEKLLPEKSSFEKDHD